jgi:prevent-host-death family protein
MEYVNIHDAKTHLSKYLQRVNQTHETIIICKNGVPIGQLAEYKQNTTRKLGVLRNKIKMSDDFDSDLPDFIIGDYK